MSHAPSMHSPHMVIPIKPKQEPGFAPVSPSGSLGGHSRSLAPTPPRPMSTHTPGMMSAGPSNSQQHTPPAQMVMGQHGPMKYETLQNNDTFTDFVTLVCQEAQNSQNHVSLCSCLFLPYFSFLDIS